MWKFLWLVLVIAAWLAWLRNNSMSSARFLYESVKSNPKTHEWLRQNTAAVWFVVALCERIAG